MPEEEQESRTRVRLPAWLFGHDVLEFASQAKFHLHPVDASQLLWDVETLERLEDRAPRLLELVPIVGPAMRPNYAALRGGPPLHSTISPETLVGERERLVGGGGAVGITPFANWLKLSVSSAPNDHLEDAVQAGYESLLGIVIEDEVAFPSVAIYFVRGDEAVTKRAALPRVLMRVEEEPHLLTERPVPSDGRTFFNSAWHLGADIGYPRDAYVGPLFLALSPWVWALSAPRLNGVVVFDLGSTIVGRSGEATELLQLFLPPGTTRSTTRPELGPADTAAALLWWVEHMDALIGDITDPARFVDATGFYRPRRQFEVLLSIEQLGKRLVSILASDRDLSGRRHLAFGALDTLEGLGVIALDEAVKLSRAQRALESLERTIPSAAARVLLPAARRAVEGLRACQAGFYLSERVGVGSIRVPDRRGGEREVPIEDAVAVYLRVLRNAGHGFTGQDDRSRRRDEILLAAHDGELDHNIYFLPYLYWLETLANRERFQRQLRPRTPRPGTSSPTS